MAEFRPVTVAEVRAAAEPLFAAHWLEVSHFAGLPLSVDWALYENLAQARALVGVGAFHAQQLVGYSAVAVHRHAYADVLVGTQLAFFVNREARGSTGVGLLRATEKFCREAGVQVLFQNGAPGSTLDKLLGLKGYTLVDHVRYKEL